MVVVVVCRVEGVGFGAIADYLSDMNCLGGVYIDLTELIGGWQPGSLVAIFCADDLCGGLGVTAVWGGYCSDLGDKFGP